MTVATWRDAEIELAESRLKALRAGVEALENIRPWLTGIERTALAPTLTMLDVREAAEQARLDQHEADLRRKDG